LILIDAPPLLEQPDVFDAGTLVPRLMLVVEAGRTSRQALERVRRELDRSNVALLGTILNKHKRYIPGWIYRCLER
jgi:Mrp family chromosome partitioning ATPase